MARNPLRHSRRRSLRQPIIDRLRRIQRFFRQIDLQARISLVLVVVVVPTFVIVTVLENKLTQPILAEEIRQIGITTGKTLAAEIVSARLLALPNPTAAIESKMQELLYSQPNIVRMQVIARDPISGTVVLVGSNVEEDDAPALPNPYPLQEGVTSELRPDDRNDGKNIELWEVSVPIEQKRRDPKAPRRLVGNVKVSVSMKVVDTIVDSLWKITATAAAASVVTLILALGYFLRKAIANDRRLREAETKNLELTQQLHEAERQLMNTEKLAVMGQLTAQFAHEIGTPLNAIGGHLSLLGDEVGANSRFDIINGQVAKIEEIVKGFLQSTAKPASQKQLVDFNLIAEKTLGIVRPRLEAMGVRALRHFDRSMGPVRAVPLDVEQILLNLVNNSLDSLMTKGSRGMQLEIETSEADGGRWAEVSVHDNGEGIARADLGKVLKPFFTTKRPGEGTGLGLTICQQLAHKHGGHLEIESKEGSWTRVTLKIPYEGGAS